MASGSDGQLIALMRLAPDQFRAAWRRGRTTQWLGAFFAWLLLTATIFILRVDPFAMSDLSLPAAETSPLADVLIAVALTFVPAIALICVWLLIPSPKRWLGSRTLRSAILTGESKQAPAAFDQPPPLVADELPRDATRFNRLRVLGFSNNLCGIVLFFVVALLASLTLLVTSALQLWRLDAQFGQAGVGGLSSLDALQGCQTLLQFLLVILTVGRAFTVIGGFQVIPSGWGALLPAPRPKLLAVDDWGIRWRPRGWRRREATLPWHDVRVFCVMRVKPGASARDAYTYLLVGDDLSFAWTLAPRAKAPMRDASALLSRLVVTRTRLPLLDTSQAIASIDQWTSAPMNVAGRKLRSRFAAKVMEEANRRDVPSRQNQELRERRHLVGYSPIADEMAPLYRASLEEIERSSSPVRPVRMRARFYWLNVLLMLLVAAGICGLWSLNNDQLTAYYQMLPARIAAETPFFSDPLTDRDYAWDIQMPTATDSTSVQYAHGGYAMTGGPIGYTNEEMVDAQYGDVAIAVTARQLGSSQNDGPQPGQRHGRF